MAYVPGKGTKLQLSIASVFTDLFQVVSVQPPQMERAEIDTTHLASTWKESFAAIPDGGEVQFNVEWDPANSTHAQLWTSFQAGTLESWKVVFPSATNSTAAFDAYIKSFPFDEVEVENVAMISFTLRISGPVTITP